MLRQGAQLLLLLQPAGRRVRQQAAASAPARLTACADIQLEPSDRSLARPHACNASVCSAPAAAQLGTIACGSKVLELIRPIQNLTLLLL